MPANTYGRQVVVPLVNKSGGSVAAGDVVIVDTTNDTAFTTTTTSRSEVSVGVVQETIASNATGRVLLSGYAALINVPSSQTRGAFVETHTVAKQAAGNSTRRSGSFGQFLTGGSTPTAWLWGQTDQTASGGGGSSAPGYEFDYAQVTSNTSVTATTEATANTVVTGASVAYDGSTAVIIEFWANHVAPDASAAARDIRLWLYDGSSSIGFIGYAQETGDGSNAQYRTMSCKRRITPSAASHTYSIRASVSAGTGTVAAGAGGSGAVAPAFIRITKV